MSRHKVCETDAVVGAVIRERRLAANISQGDIGTALGISFQQVQKYERGYNRMAVATFVKAAKALGAEPSALLLEVERRL